MFYYIEGKLAHLDYAFAVIDANGVGYKMTVTQNTYEALARDGAASSVRLYTYLAVREDGIELFGFASADELEAFKLLISVSGIGPKAAISILSVFTPDTLSIAICNEDAKAISRANGIGAKTAARVVLELKDKVAKSFADNSRFVSSGTSSATINTPSGSSKLSDAQSALLVLGYTKSEILAALKNIDINNKETNDIIRLALKNLSK